MKTKNYVSCPRCNWPMSPNIYVDEISKATMVSGLTCKRCNKKEITHDMPLSEYYTIITQGVDKN